MNDKPNAYTLVEVLVVIAIIGILLSLTLTALGPAKDRSRRLQCANNQRQLAHGLLLHESAKGHFPGFVQKYGDFAGGSDPTDPTNFGGAVPAHEKVAGFGVAVLPFLDRQPLYEIWTDDRYPIISDSPEATTGPDAGTNFSPLAASGIATFQCPSDVTSSRWSANSYVTNNGMAHPINTALVTFLATQSKNNGIFNAKFTTGASGPNVSLSDITDGLSSTALLSENVQALPWFRPGFLNGGDMSSIAYGNALTNARYTAGMVWHPEDDELGVPVAPDHKINGPNRRSLTSERMTAGNARDLARPSSLHIGGVNVAYADGAVGFVSDTIDYRVYQAILTPRGRASDVPHPGFILTDELSD